MPSENLPKLTLLLVDPQLSQAASCDCKSKKRACFHSTLSRHPELLAQRIAPSKGNQQVNLAKLGKYRAPKHPVFEQKLKYVHIEFRGPEERDKFDTEYQKTIEIYRRKLKVYRYEMSKVKKDHVG